MIIRRSYVHKSYGKILGGGGGSFKKKLLLIS